MLERLSLDNIFFSLGKKEFSAEKIDKKLLERILFNVNDGDFMSTLEQYLPLSLADSKLYDNIVDMMDKEITNHLGFYRFKTKWPIEKIAISLKNICNVKCYLSNNELGYILIMLINYFMKDVNGHF